MGAFDFIVAGIIFIAVLSAVIWIVRKKKKGGHSCNGCPYADGCTDKSCP